MRSPVYGAIPQGWKLLSGDSIMKPKYLVFDIETVPDLRLFQFVKYPGLTTQEAVSQYAKDKGIAEEDVFIPVTFHRVVSCVMLKVAQDFSVLGLPVISNISSTFWNMVDNYQPILVTFNGRRFDLPVLTCHAFREGTQVPKYFNSGKWGYTYRYTDMHIDLMDWFTSYGAFPCSGGLGLLSRLAGGPGKGGVSGSDVARMYEEGRSDEIHEYCRRDVIETYRVFLRSRVLMGQLSAEKEKELMEDLDA